MGGGGGGQESGVGRQVMIDEGWRRIVRIMGEAFDAYEKGLVALRKRVVDDVRRKLSDRTHVDPHDQREKSRSGRSGKRG